MAFSILSWGQYIGVLWSQTFRGACRRFGQALTQGPSRSKYSLVSILIPVFVW